jgi:hypothetical protein
MTRHKAMHRDRYELMPVSRNACGRFAYVSADHARRRDSNEPGKSRRPYECPDCNLWHLRTLPALVRQGVVTEAEWFGEDGNPCYLEILLGVSAWLRARGIHHHAWSRGRDGESWILTATADGADLIVHDQPDPVTAGESMFVQVNVMRAQRMRDREARAA